LDKLGYVQSGDRVKITTANNYNFSVNFPTQAEYDQIVAQAPLIANLEELNKLVENNGISWNEYLGIVRDGKVTNEELIAALESTGLSAEEAAAQVAILQGNITGLGSAIDLLPDRKSIIIQVDQIGNTNIPNIPYVPNTGNIIFYQHQNGLDYVIPPGYPNDSFPLGKLGYAQSGERVTITPANNYNFSVNFPSTGQTRGSVMSDIRLLNSLYGR